MQAPFKSFVIDLLAKSDPFVSGVSGEEYLQDDIEWYQYPIQDGVAGFSSLKLSGGLTLHHSLVKLDEPEQGGQFIEFCRAKIDFIEPVLQIHCMLSGQVKRKDLATRQEYLIEEDQAYVCLSSHAYFSVAMKAQTEAESLHLSIGLTALRELLGSACADDLCEQVQLQNFAVHKLGRSVISSVHFSLDEDLPLVVRKLRSHARCLEFLASLVMRFVARRAPSAPARSSISASLIRQYIRQHYRECITLTDLAKAFGVTTRTINNVLVRETGMPAARLMREQRLSLAHEMIQQTDMPLSEVSARLGYRHLSNFSTAFKKLFGYAPNVLRQSEHAYRSPVLAGLRIPGSIDWKKD